MAEITTTELDTSKEKVSPNGHDEHWREFTDDMALLNFILGKKPAEELMPVDEWGVKILCRALNAESRIKIQIAAYNEETKRTDYRTVFPTIILAGCYNPKTGGKIFTESSLDKLMREQDGAPIERLGLAILRLSGMLSTDGERARKN